MTYVGRTIVNCCQVTMIWYGVDHNFGTSSVYVLSMGTTAGIFAMLDIIVEVWFLCERLHD